VVWIGLVWLRIGRTGGELVFLTNFTAYIQEHRLPETATTNVSISP
jgi:hypothetical protein